MFCEQFTPLIETDCDLARPCQTVLNRSVLYDDEGVARMQEIVNYLVLYRIIYVWRARRTLAVSKCWRRRCLSSGPMDFRTPVFTTWSEPPASTSQGSIQSSGTRKIFL